VVRTLSNIQGGGDDDDDDDDDDGDGTPVLIRYLSYSHYLWY
jgi:hypothetical protein